jgi:hypothetical protein
MVHCQFMTNASTKRTNERRHPLGPVLIPIYPQMITRVHQSNRSLSVGQREPVCDHVRDAVKRKRHLFILRASVFDNLSSTAMVFLRDLLCNLLP